MTHSSLRFGVELAAIGVLGGCVTPKDYGRGKCSEYKPHCVPMVCVRDDRGCESCTCTTYGNPAPPAR